MKQALAYIAERLAEPSTQASLAAMAMGLGINADPGLIKNIGFAVAGLCGLLGFFLPEKK